MLRSLSRNNYLLMLALFVWALGEGLWLPTRQLYFVELGATAQQVGIILAIEGIIRIVFVIPGGYIADRIGPYKVLLASWLVGVTGPVFMALANHWTWAIPGLMLYSLSAFAFPVISSYALLSLPDDSAPGITAWTLSTTFAAYYIGMIISPTLGGILADATSIRMNLWVGSALFALSTLVVISASAVQPHASQTTSTPRALLKNRLFLKLCIYYFIAMGVIYIGYPLAPNFLQDARGLSFSSIGILLSVLSVGTVVLNIIFGRISSRWNFAGILVVVWLSMLGMWQLTSFAGIALAFFALGGYSTARTLATAGIARVVPSDNQSLAFGILESLLSLNMAIISGIAGTLYELTPGHELPLIAGLIATPVVIVLWFAVKLWQNPVAEINQALLVTADPK